MWILTEQNRKRNVCREWEDVSNNVVYNINGIDCKCGKIYDPTEKDPNGRSNSNEQIGHEKKKIRRERG